MYVCMCVYIYIYIYTYTYACITINNMINYHNNNNNNSPGLGLAGDEALVRRHEQDGHVVAVVALSLRRTKITYNNRHDKVHDRYNSISIYTYICIYIYIERERERCLSKVNN